MIRTRNDTVRVRTENNQPSMTKSDMAEACNINNILARYRKTGVISHIRAGGTYETLPSQMDFHEAMNLVLKAQTMFDEMPSNLRKRFSNDPGVFLAFCEDPENRDEMVDLGLLPRPPKAAQTPAPEIVEDEDPST